MPSNPPVRDEAPLRAALAEVDRGARLQVLDVSFSSAVLQFGSTVARVARNGDAQRGHQREATLLPLLTGRLPVAIPVPIRLLPSKPGLPFGAALQPWIDGRTMSRRDPRRRPELVDEIVRALAALHAVSAYRMIREVAGFAYLVRNDITEEIDDAVRKIEALIP